MRMRFLSGVLLTLITGGMTACNAVEPRVEERSIAGTRPADEELREALRRIAKAHNGRLNLATYVAIPFIHKIDKPISDFVRDMKKPNEDLLAEYEKFGKSAKIDLSFRFEAGILPQSQKRMEGLQGDAMMAAKDEFGFYILMFSFMDYSWGQSLLERTLKQSKSLDPALKALLERDLIFHQDAVATISEMIKKYRP